MALFHVLATTLMQDQPGIGRPSYYRLRYFFIDKSGKVVIDASQYEAVFGFSEGLAAVRDGRGWGFIDKAGREIIEPHFEGAFGFSEGLAPVQVDGLWGFIDKRGQIVIEPQYDLANPFSEGVAVVVKDQARKAFHRVKVDPSESIVVQSRVVRHRRVLIGEGAEDLYSEQAAQLVNKEVQLIDPTGQPILSRRLADLRLNVNGRFSEGVIQADDPTTDKVGFIDKTGSFVIEPAYVQAAPFSEGKARVAIIENEEEKVGFIDHSGRFVIPPTFNTDADFSRNSTDFSEGLAGITEGLRPTITDEEKFAYIDKQGEIILFTSFFYAGSFRDGLASVYDAEKDRWGFIDKTAKVVIPLRYNSVSDFSEGLALVGVLTN